MEDRTQHDKDQKQNTSTNQQNNPIPQNQRPAEHPGADAAAKTERKGAGQQQDSAGNTVINS